MFHHSSLVGLAFLLLAGCAKTPPAVVPAKPPEVIVARPIEKKITDFEDFIGRTEAYASVEIRARATGYLKKVHFEDGATVSATKPLFDIDPTIYDAEVHRAKASVDQADALVRRLETDKKRVDKLRPQGTISQEEADKVYGDYEVAKAAVGVAKANLELAEKNLGFTHVFSPMDGKIGKRLLDPGAMVKADETPLAVIVSMHPIYATFDVDERTELRLRRLAEQGVIPSAEKGIEVRVGLADEEGWSLTGTVKFKDNVVNPNTGTIRVRSTLDNTKELLSPGLFVRIRFPIGKEHPAILVPEEALGSDQGQKYLFVVNDQDEVVYRRVKIGASDDGYRVIIEGLAAGERIIVSGLQRVRPGIKVTPKTVTP